MTEAEVVTILARHTLPANAGFSDEERSALYNLAFGLDRTTSVMKRIPRRSFTGAD